MISSRLKQSSRHRKSNINKKVSVCLRQVNKVHSLDETNINLPFYICHFSIMNSSHSYRRSFWSIFFFHINTPSKRRYLWFVPVFNLSPCQRTGSPWSWPDTPLTRRPEDTTSSSSWGHPPQLWYLRCPGPHGTSSRWWPNSSHILAPRLQKTQRLREQSSVKCELSSHYTPSNPPLTL